jgi:hypothetical protein
MFDVSFKMNGRNVRPGQMGKELEKAALESAKNDFLAHVKKQTRGIRDPKTGALPRFRVKGNRLDRLSVEVIGSEELIRLVENRLR